MYCKTRKNGKVHRVHSHEYRARNYVISMCGQRYRQNGIICDTGEEFWENGCKECRERLIGRVIVKLQHGV
jgi:hypothetical protein